MQALWRELHKLLSTIEDISVETEKDGSQNDISHLAAALSVQDLHKRVKERLPEGTPIPSEQWLRLQFWPCNLSNTSARYHTGRLKLKQDNFKKNSHYASALFFSVVACEVFHG